jgi:hypothetical protein
MQRSWILLLVTCALVMIWGIVTRGQQTSPSHPTVPAAEPSQADAKLEGASAAGESAALADQVGPGGDVDPADAGPARPARLEFVNVKVNVPQELQDRQRDEQLLKAERIEMGLGPDPSVPGE